MQKNAPAASLVLSRMYDVGIPHGLTQLPAHHIQARQQHKEADGHTEHIRMLQRMDQVVRHIEQDTCRVHQHIPAVPAQIPAQVDRKTAQEQYYRDKHTGSPHADTPTKLHMDHVQTTETDQRRRKDECREHHYVVQQIVPDHILDMHEIADHIKTVRQEYQP